MPVPAAIGDISQTAGSNYPAGTESPTSLDDYLRAYASFIALLRDGKGHATEVDVASAATCNIGAADSPCIRITGTSGITSFGTPYNGPRFIRFAGALNLTHNASTLILPGGLTITTAAGDTCVAVPVGNPASGWAVMGYQKAGLAPGVATVASSASALVTPRNLTLTGDVTASLAGFNGSGDVSAAATIPAGSLAFAKMVATDWTNTKADPGSFKLPSGLVVKFGSVSAVTGTAAQTVTFAEAFPTACLFVITNPNVAGGGAFDAGYWAVTSKSTTQFTTSYTASRVWLAIGY